MLMKHVMYRGKWHKVTPLGDEQYRLQVPGERNHMTFSREGFEKIIKDIYRTGKKIC